MTFLTYRDIIKSSLFRKPQNIFGKILENHTGIIEREKEREYKHKMPEQSVENTIVLVLKCRTQSDYDWQANSWSFCRNVNGIYWRDIWHHPGRVQCRDQCCCCCCDVSCWSSGTTCISLPWPTKRKTKRCCHIVFEGLVHSKMKVLPLVKNKYTKIDLKYIYFMLSILQIHWHIMCLLLVFHRLQNVIYSCDVKQNFQHHHSSLQCHMIFRNHLIYWFAAQETFLIFINVENGCAASYYYEQPSFQDSLINNKTKYLM